MDIDLIGVGVDTKGVKQGSRELDKLDKSATKASRSADNLTKSSTGVSKSSGAAARSIGALAIAYGALRGAKALGGVIDDYTKFNAQIKLATKNQDEYNEAMGSVKRIATTAQASISSIATLYARLSNSLSELGVQQSKIATISETVALGLKVAGASAGEASSVMLQLSQGFAAGALRGDEFNSMAENAPSLMKALAESMGVTTGELRAMAQEGEITRDVLLKAFGDDVLLSKFREQAKEIKTLSGAFQTMKNEFVLLVGKIAEKTGIVDIFTVSINAGSQALKSFNDLLTTGQIRIEAFLPAYAAYRKKMDAEDAAAGKGFKFAGKIGDEISAEDIAGIPSFGGILTAVDPAKKADEIIKASKKASAAIKADVVDVEAQRYKIEVEMAEDARQWRKSTAEVELKEKEEAEKKWMEYKQKLAIENFEEAKKANKEFEDERRREAEKTSDFLTRSITDGLMRGFESGKSFAQNFIDTLKNMFKSLVLQPIVRFLVDSSGITKVMGAIGGAFSGSVSASGAAGGGSSVTSLLGGFKDILSAGNGSIVSSIESLGTFLSTGNGGLGDMLGGALGQYASQIADVLPYAGAALQLLSGDVKGAAFTGAGTAIGSALGGPIGGAIGGALGSFVGSLFGGASLPPRVTAAQSGALSNGVYVGAKGSEYGEAISGGNSSLNQLNETFSRRLDSLLSAFDINSTIGTHAVITKKKKYETSFGATIDGQTAGYSYQQFGKKDDMAAVFAQVAGKALGTILVQSIQKSSLSDGIKRFFDGLVKKEDVAATIQAIVSVKSALTDLPEVFNAIRFELDTTLFKSNASQLTARFQALSNYTNLFYSDTEKLDTAFKQITTQFSALGQTLPSSRDEFRALIDGFNVFDEASANTFYGLVALAPALDTYYNALTNQKDALDALNGAMRDSNSFSNIIDFQRYQSTATNFGSTSANTLLSDSPAVIGILSQLRDEIISLRTTSAATAKSSQTTADLLNNVTLGGEALQTQAAA